MNKSFYGVLLCLCLLACASDMPPIVGCDSVGDIKPVCNMKTPEDIAALADGRHLLLANFGGMEGGTGSISLFDTQTEEVSVLFPPQNATLNATNVTWGDADCPPPSLDKFSPHGTHLRRLAAGGWRYLVVNHGGRESIEFFELTLAGGNSSIAWRGCVLAAAETFMNDVVGLPNGDLIFSRMFHQGGDLEMLKSIVGIDTGDLWRWNQETGLRILPGTDAAQPNGLELSADGRYVFANMYMEGEVWKIDVDTGKTVAVGDVANGDNSAWGSDGRLWVATHTAGAMDMLSCFDFQDKPCGAAFEIVAMDPETMAAEVVFSHAGAPMGAATIAVPQGGRVYMGSFVGDRLISVPDFGSAK
ncbi:MAG: SMP-30/gluconolactonase/LRE family protein [Halioglobus sp.]